MVMRVPGKLAVHAGHFQLLVVHLGEDARAPEIRELRYDFGKGDRRVQREHYFSPVCNER